MKDFTFSSTTLHDITRIKNGSLKVEATFRDVNRVLCYEVIVPENELSFMQKPDFRLKSDKELLCLIVRDLIKEKAYSKVAFQKPVTATTQSHGSNCCFAAMFEETQICSFCLEPAVLVEAE